ncbi:MAG: hypothetical protein ACK55Z_32770 [bacterium]
MLSISPKSKQKRLNITYVAEEVKDRNMSEQQNYQQLTIRRSNSGANTTGDIKKGDSRAEASGVQQVSLGSRFN